MEPQENNVRLRTTIKKHTPYINLDLSKPNMRVPTLQSQSTQSKLHTNKDSVFGFANS